MERNYNNDFERFLKQNADQYRLYPSAKPWKGIYTHFHGKRRWFGLGAILLLVTGSLLTVITINSAKEPVASVVKPSSNSIAEKQFNSITPASKAESKPQNLFTQKQERLPSTETFGIGDFIGVNNTNQVGLSNINQVGLGNINHVSIDLTSKITRRPKQLYLHQYL